MTRYEYITLVFLYLLLEVLFGSGHFEQTDISEDLEGFRRNAFISAKSKTFVSEMDRAGRSEASFLEKKTRTMMMMNLTLRF